MFLSPVETKNKEGGCTNLEIGLIKHNLVGQVPGPNSIGVGRGVYFQMSIT